MLAGRQERWALLTIQGTTQQKQQNCDVNLLSLKALQGLGLTLCPHQLLVPAKSCMPL